MTTRPCRIHTGYRSKARIPASEQSGFSTNDPGTDIAQREQQKIRRDFQLDWPVIRKQADSHPAIEMEGPGCRL